VAKHGQLGLRPGLKAKTLASILLDLLPLPEFGDCVAGGIYFVFEGSARVVNARKLLGRGSEEQHAAVADGTAGPEFAHARCRPSDRLAILRHVQSLSLAMKGAIRVDDRCEVCYGGMAFSEANLKPFVRVCSSLPGEPHPYSAFWRFRSHCWRIVGTNRPIF